MELLFFFFFKLRFPTFQCRKDSSQYVFKYSIYWAFNCTWMTLLFICSSHRPKASVEACLQRCGRGTGPECQLQSRSSVSARFGNRNGRSLQAQRPFCVYSEMSRPLWTRSFGFFVAERNGVHNWIRKSVNWLLAATVVPSEDRNGKNHTSDVFAALRHDNTLLYMKRRPLKSTFVRFNLLRRVLASIKR